MTRALVGLVVAYVLVGLATLTAFPLVWQDEPWYTASAWSFVRDGTFALPLFGDLAGFDRENVVYGRLYLLLEAGSYGALGATPFAARLPPFISALVAVTATFAVGRELWSPRAGVLAAVLLAVAPNFIAQSHDARPEMMLIALAAVASYLALSGARTGLAWRLVAGGLAASLAADIHLNGLVVPIALVAVLLVRRASLRSLALFVAGAAAGGLWWLWVHVVNDSGLLLDQMDTFGSGSPLTDALSDPLVVLAVEAARYLLVPPAGAAILTVLAAIAAVFLLWRRRDRGALSVVAYCAMVFLFMAVAAGAKTPIYAILLWPAFALLVARLADVVAPVARWAIVGGVAAVSLLALVPAVARDHPADLDRYLARVTDEVPSGVTVQGPMVAWFGFADEDFVPHEVFLWTGPYDEAARGRGVEYIVADPSMYAGMDHLYSIDPADFGAFVEEHAELVAEFDDPTYWHRAVGPEPSTTRIYRVVDPG